MRNLAELQAECAALGIKLETSGRASKEPYILALRDHHWRKEHPDEPLPIQIQPMSLTSWGDLDEVAAASIDQDCHAWIVQPKLDGVRALFHIEENRVRITGRTISEVSYRLSEFQDNLPHLTQSLSGLGDTILDGELVCPVARVNTGSTATETSLQATTAILATSPDNAHRIQIEQDAPVRFHTFDILRFRGQDVTPRPLIDRQSLLDEALQQSENSFVETVPSFVVNKPDVHRRVLANDGEGTVWKKVDRPYEPGRRVGHWIKRKRGIEVEAFVTGFKPGMNGHAGLVGAVEFGARQHDGSIKPLAWVSGWSDQERTAMTKHDSSGNVMLDSTFFGRRAVIVGHDVSAKSRRLRHARIDRWLDDQHSLNG